MPSYCFDYINSELLDVTQREASINRRVMRELSYLSLNHAYILPCKNSWKDGKLLGGVVDCNMNFIMSSAWHEGIHRCDKYDFEPSNARYYDETVIYMGFLTTCWGHAITDNLKKLWFLDTEECKNLLHNGAKLVYMTTDNTPMPQYVHRLFQLADSDLNKMNQITELSCYKRIIIPDNSFIANEGYRYWTNEYRKTVHRIIKNTCPLVNARHIQKIYFTRTGIKGHRDIGEHVLENVFKKEGYHIISPETLTPDEQIQLLQCCTHFAATEGSISHNAVFCRPGTVVTIIRKCNNINQYQLAINDIADVVVKYVDANKSCLAPKLQPWAGPFYMCITSELERYVGHYIPHIPLWLRPSWYRYRFQLDEMWMYKKFRHALQRYV